MHEVFILCSLLEFAFKYDVKIAVWVDHVKVSKVEDEDLT